MLGALIHDIGKLEIPWSILNKERSSHARNGIPSKAMSPGAKNGDGERPLRRSDPVLNCIMRRYDGQGYPYGLKGQEIPKLCRMLTVIDSFDAMTTERPYQKTKNVDEAIQELRACSGTQFDPELAELFIRYIEKRAAHQLLQ